MRLAAVGPVHILNRPSPSCLGSTVGITKNPCQGELVAGTAAEGKALAQPCTHCMTVFRIGAVYQYMPTNTAAAGLHGPVQMNQVLCSQSPTVASAHSVSRAGAIYLSSTAAAAAAINRLSWPACTPGPLLPTQPAATPPGAGRTPGSAALGFGCTPAGQDGHYNQQ